MTKKEILNNNDEDVLTRHLLKLSEIEQQFQQLTNKFEEINFKIDKLSSRLSKVQADNQLRFQELEVGNGNIVTSNLEKKLPGSSQPQDLGSITYKDTENQDLAQKTQSIETTSSVVTVGTNNVDTCNAGDIFIMYAWHSVPGYSKIGKYTGNGSSDGPYVEIGFEPALVIIKRTDNTSGAHWVFLDNKRNSYNPINRNIYANLNNDDGVTERGDFLANGFKIRQNGTTVNASGGTYIYMAFAESPFTNSNSVPTNAR